MGERNPITVVVIDSPSYSGMSWLCMVLGSHPRAFALGAPDNVWNRRREDWDDICRVHGRDCPFWPGFFARYRPEDNFYRQLADASDCDVIVTNNPSRVHAEAELTDPGLIIRRIQLVRDGRAIACSYARHQEVDFYDAVKTFATQLYPRYTLDRPENMALRYEDLMSDQSGHLERLGELVGLDYGDEALRFWDFDHHMTTANAGSILLLKLLQGTEVKQGRRDRSFYREQHERIIRNGGTFKDERWKSELGQRERFVFDHFCGRGNAAWGYEEDAFTASEREQFRRELAVELRPARTATTQAARRLIRYLSSRTGQLGSRPRRLMFLVAVVWLLSLALTWILCMIVVGA